MPSPTQRIVRVLNKIPQSVLNLRTGAEINFDVIVAIPEGTSNIEVRRCRQPDDGDGADWCEVQWRGYTGWVSSRFLEEVSQPGRRMYRVASNVPQGVLNIRKGRGTNHGVIISIPAGVSNVVVGECQRSDSGGRTVWCEVEWQGHKGFASNRYLIDPNTGASAK
jgi:uncharacterized protein YraI